MSDDTVRPALTAEEWRKKEVAQRGHAPFLGYAHNPESYWKPDAEEPCGILISDCSTEQMVLPTSCYHAVAALALYGQPFGFTREDVELLRHAAAALLEVARDGEEQARGDAASNLADRIAALLPPDPGAG